MGEGLASQRSIDHVTLFGALRRVVERVSRALEGESALDDCLDIVVEILGADRGLIIVAHADGSTMPVNARRKGASLDVTEREEISKSIVRDALDSGQLIMFQPNMQSVKSVTMLGIVTALAVP